MISLFIDADACPVLLLLGLYAKNEKADLSTREKKKLADAVKEITGPWRRK